jgi:endonuclease-3
VKDKKDTNILPALKAFYPDAHCELDFKNPFQLLIATILSAQCTDKRVNIVTKVLFKRFPDPESLSNGEIKEIEEIINSTGFYINKAKNIKQCASTLVQKYQGEVPKTLGQLIELAGVGRKTANVVLGNAFGITSGITVDTHVGRLAKRFGWTRFEDPVHIEKDLQKIIPYEDWILISHLLIWHGRRVCKSRNPDCRTCFLFDGCPRVGL